MSPQMGAFGQAEVAALIAAHAADYGLHTRLVRKTTDEIVNNSNVLQDDDELKLPLAANEVWEFRLLILYISGFTPDLKISFSVPSGATMKWLISSQESSAKYAGSTESIDGTGAIRISFLEGIVMCGATAGDLQFQWAQDVADPSDTKVLTNSALIGVKLA